MGKVSRQREWQKKQIEQGKCPRCGRGCLDYLYCSLCREKRNTEAKQSRAKKAAK